VKKRLYSAGLTGFLVLCIFFILLILQSRMYLGSYFMNETWENEIYQSMTEKMKAESSRFLGCYKLEETVFSAEIVKDSQHHLIWFDEELNLLKQVPYSTYDLKKINQKADELKMSDYDIQLGWYLQKPVVVLKDKQQEILLDYVSLETVLIYKRG